MSAIPTESSPHGGPEAENKSAAALVSFIMLSRKNPIAVHGIQMYILRAGA